MGYQYSAADRAEITDKAVELRAKGLSFRAIGRELGPNHITIETWLENEYARRSEHRGIDKEKHLATFDTIQKEAWDGYASAPASSPHRIGYLNTIKAAEDSKVKITGAEAPKKYQNVDDTFEIVFDDDENSVDDRIEIAR